MPFISHRAAIGPEQPAAGPSPAEWRRQLGAPDAALRRAAAQALAQDPDAVPALVAALDDEREQPVKSALLGALAAIGSEEATCALAECLRSEDAWLRNAAIELLRAAPAGGAVMEQLMANLLVDWDRDVRILAIGILDSLRHERVEEWLLQLIEVESDHNVCGAALEVLAEVATEAARGPVERLLERFAAEPFIGFAGKLVLRRLVQA